MKSFSIVICTYNPDFTIFKRLLDVLLRFESIYPNHEVIIIDNNSQPGIQINSIVKDFLVIKANTRLIKESTLGLTAARIAGIKAAKFDWLIFFDDDNEPSSDYLIKANAAIQKYPQVGSWGAAEVEVEYIGAVHKWLEVTKPLFQQRNVTSTQFDNQTDWQHCYPFGTGLIISKTIAEKYEERVRRRVYTLTDRKGKSLASGGDVQLVLTGIEQGYFAGIIAELKIKHLIDKSKATIDYLQKQQYGTASAYIIAYNQVFTQSPIIVRAVNNKQVLITAYCLFRIYYRKLIKEQFRLLFASKMGELNARVEAQASKPPFLLRLYEKYIHG
jgi:glycosyltransferase involved in cell wall biosynthesis